MTFYWTTLNKKCAYTTQDKNLTDNLIDTRTKTYATLQELARIPRSDTTGSSNDIPVKTNNSKYLQVSTSLVTDLGMECGG